MPAVDNLSEKSTLLPKKNSEKSVSPPFFTNTLKERLRSATVISLMEALVLTGEALIVGVFNPKRETEAMFNPLVFTSVVCAFNTLVRICIAYIGDKHPNKESVDRWFNLLTSSTYTLVDSRTKEVLIHESGHAAATFLFFKNPRPRITIPYSPNLIKLFSDQNAGWTNYHNGKLSSWGEYFGRDESSILVSGAGTAATLLENWINLIIAQALPSRFGQAKSHLRVAAIMSILNSCLYALSPQITNCDYDGDDFCNFSQDVPTAATITFIVGFTVALQLLLSFAPKCYRMARDNCNKIPESKEEEESPRLEV